MAAKPDSKEKEAPAARAGTRPAAAPAEAAAAARKGGSPLKTWLPVLAAIIIAPGATFAVAQFVLLPKLQAQLAAAADGPADAHAPGQEKPAEGREEGEGHRAARKARAPAPPTPTASPTWS